MPSNRLPLPLQLPRRALAPIREVDNSFESLGTFGILTTVADPMLILGYLGMIGSVT